MKDFIRLRIPTPFPVGPTNVYLLKTDPLTLIDTGPNTKLARAVLGEALANEGVSLEDIRRVLITHGHSDHSGLAGWLQEKGATIHIHPHEAKKLSGIDYLPVRSEFLKEMGTPAEDIFSFRAMAAINVNCSLPAFHAITAGDEIEFDGFSLSVRDTAGHCGGHLAFYHGETECLFGGDAILRDISPNPLPELDPANPGTRSGSLAKFFSTLDRLENMAVEWVLPGHGETVINLVERINEMRNHHEERLQHILNRLQDCMTPYSLATEIYGKLSGWNVFLAVAEVCAHLDLLVEQGLIREETNKETAVHTYQRKG